MWVGKSKHPLSSQERHKGVGFHHHMLHGPNGAELMLCPGVCHAGTGPPRKVAGVPQGANIKLTRGLLACLNDHQWLNDEVINFYMGLLQVGCIASPCENH